MPGTATANTINQVFTPLVLSTAEDTYTITAGRNFSRCSPLTLRIVSDTNPILIGTTTAGPYYFQPTTWSNDYRFTLNQGQALVLYIKATVGTPSVYLMAIDSGGE